MISRQFPAFYYILLHLPAFSCITLRGHRILIRQFLLFISFFLLSLYILLLKTGRGNAFEDQYHENRDVQKKTCFRSFLSFFGIKADISGSIGKQNGKIEPMCYWVTAMIPAASLQVRQNRRHSVFSPLFLLSITKRCNRRPVFISSSVPLPRSMLSRPVRRSHSIHAGTDQRSGPAASWGPPFRFRTGPSPQLRY